MAKILKYERKAGDVISAAVAFIDAADYNRAFIEMRQLRGKSLSTADETARNFTEARLYYETENYQNALDCFHALLALGADEAVCYYWLHLTHKALRQYDASVDYLMKLFELEPKLAEEAFSGGADEDEPRRDPRYRLAYKAGRPVADKSKIGELIAKGRYDDLIDYCESFETTDEGGLFALNYSAVAHLLKDDPKSAKEVADRILASDKDNVQAHCLLATVAQIEGDEAGIAREVECIGKLPLETRDDLVRAVSVFCDAGKYDEAVPLFEAIAMESPFNIDCLYSLGAGYFNSKQFEKARRVFVRILLIDEFFYYAEFALNRIKQIESGEQPFEPISVLHDDCEEECVRKVVYLRTVSDKGTLDKMTGANREFVRAVLAVFRGCGSEYQCEVAKLIASSKCSAKGEITRLLLTGKFLMAVKKEIIKECVLQEDKGTYPLVVGNTFKRLRLSYPVGFDGYNKTFKTAYADCVSTFMLIADESLDEVVRAFEEAYKNHFMQGLNLTDSEAIAASVVMRTTKLFGLNECAELFLVKKETLKEYSAALFPLKLPTA